MAEPYAPSDMKPAWPMQNCPVNPFTRFRLTVIMMLMPANIRICTMYWLTILYCLSSISMA